MCARESDGAGIRRGSGRQIHFSTEGDRRFQALIEATGQIVWSWSPASNQEDSENARRWWHFLTGQTLPKGGLQQAWLEVVHEDDQAASRMAWTKARDSGTAYDFEFRVRSQSGEWRHIRSRGCPVRDSQGIIEEWIGTLDDVTVLHATLAERGRLLAEANTERRQLEEVFHYAPSFIAVLRGPDHVFERVNQRYVELIGGREVIGKSVREALPEIEGQGYFELLDRVYSTGEPYTLVDAKVTLNRAERPTTLSLEFVYQPMLDATGNVTGIICQGIDLTEKRAAEANVARVTAESERLRRMYATALSNTADFVYLFDLDGRFTYVNQSLLNLLQKELTDVVGKDFFELDYPSDLAAKLHAQIKQVIASGLTLRDETNYTSPLGTESYEYIFVPVWGIDGKVEAVAGSTREISERKRTEHALRESEQRHRALVTATSDVVYGMSADWSEMKPLDGRGLVASNTHPISDWLEKNVPRNEHARLKHAIRDAIDRKGPFELEHQIYRSDGSLGWTFSRAIPLLDADGEIREWFGTASDVTRRKAAEEALNDIRSRMEAALAAGAIGTWSWDVEADCFYGDASLARIFGVDQPAVDGGKISMILKSIHDDDIARVTKLIEEALAHGDQYEADYRVKQPDGGVKWVTARGRIERDSNRIPIRFPGVVIDVTERKLAEANLSKVSEESERRRRIYETILSNTPDFAYVIGLDHRFVYCNDPLLRMWGCRWEDAIGKTFLEIGYEPWHAEMHEREVDQVKLTRQPVRGEIPFHGTHGRRIYDYIFVPVFDANGEVEAVAGTTRDVTDRKASEEASREADRKKDDFLALLAHELRNPLAPIRNGLQVMRLADGDLEAIAHAREMMDRQLSHMVRLIDDLLDISRITRNKMELRRSRISLEEVVKHAVEASAHLVGNAEHILKVSLPPEPVMLDADLTRLAQVLSNLLANSAKYTPRGGNISLSAKQADHEVVISVSDTGLGIPAAALPRIFDMFSQVDRNVERSTGGLGIGLALVKGLVEMHGGIVSVESVEGAGSTFYVRLPIASTQMVGNDMTTPDKTRKDAKRRVLVVDDNLDGAASMALMLRLIGNEVATAHDGLEAVKLAESFQPELILMDIGLPKLNGLEATRQIRQQAWGQNIPIIALTGWGQDSDRERSRDAGCVGHLVKPVELAALQEIIQNIRSGS